MAASPSSKLAVLLFAVFLLLRTSAAMAQEVEDEKEFNYEIGDQHGPENWGSIHEDWAACGTGRMQSPIDLHHERVQVVDSIGALRRHYRPARAVMKNRGHDVMIRWEEDAGGLLINGTEYMLRQLHWHSPSEHTVNGRRYLLEVHLVHESADKKIAVVGILYTAGRPDPFISQMESYIEKLTNLADQEEDLGLVDAWQVRWGSRKYYRYMGSLTTPPCTEGVTWSIIKKVRTVSKEQVRLLKEVVQDGFEENARPTQLTNGREIFLYRPMKSPKY